MNNFKRKWGTVLLKLGIDPRKIFFSLSSVPSYFIGLYKFKKELARKGNSDFRLELLPVLSDLNIPSGVAKGHYFHQDLWAAKHIFKKSPNRHIDVGSRIDGFVSHLLVFRDVEVIDVRYLPSKVKGLRFKRADLMDKKMHFREFLTDSLSCLHTLEHLGLGRYGDSLNPDGWKIGIENLAYMLNSGGTLYLSVPIGPQSIEFNAHRIFDPKTIVEYANRQNLNLFEFSFIDDNGDFHQRTKTEEASGCRYGCGCFLFRKSKNSRKK